MLLYSIAKIFVIFDVFCIPFTGCLVKHTLKSILRGLVSVLDKFRHNYAYRLLKTLIGLFWLFLKFSRPKTEDRSTVPKFSIDEISSGPSDQFLKTFSDLAFFALF